MNRVGVRGGGRGSSHPEVFLFKSFHFAVVLANLVQVELEVVHIVQRPDTFVQRVHDGIDVLSQFIVNLLLIPHQHFIRFKFRE